MTDARQNQEQETHFENLEWALFNEYLQNHVPFRKSDKTEGEYAHALQIPHIRFTIHTNASELRFKWLHLGEHTLVHVLDQVARLHLR